jgi:hypothetical protein
MSDWSVDHSRYTFDFRSGCPRSRESDLLRYMAYAYVVTAPYSDVGDAGRAAFVNSRN